MLTERRQKILQFIVDEYVNSAQPVGSGAIVEKYRLPVSSATIRNEMSALEEEGFIAQPHTSAGRVPTDSGYRYYVEALMREEALPDELQQMIRRQFQQAARELEEWARLAAGILASRLHNAAVATPAHSPQPRLRWLEIVAVHDYLALLLIVLQEARVLQQTLSLELPLDQEDMTTIARRLSDLLSGKNAAQIRAMRLEQTPIEKAVTEIVAETLDASEAAGIEQSFLEGLRELLGQPEFTHGQQALNLLELLEERNLPRAIPAPPAGGSQIKIIIGGEHPVDVMRMCSVISVGYSGPSGLHGMLGVVGPTRMHYPRAVSMVRYMSSLMEELLGAYFA